MTLAPRLAPPTPRSSLALGLALVAASLLPASLAAAPLEADAIWSSQWSEARAQELADEASALIEAQGWRCDSVSNLQAWITSRGYDVHCNGFRYAYELEDQGGRWVASLK